MANVTKSDRLELRLTSEQKSEIEQAAALSGRTVTDFSVSVLVREADDVIRFELMPPAARRAMFLLVSDAEATIASISSPRPRPIGHPIPYRLADCKPPDRSARAK